MDASMHHHVSEPSVVVAIVFASIACYNSLEVIFWIFVTFKNRHGLYFWSMQFAAWGTIVNVAFGIVYAYLKDPSIGWSVGIFIGLWAMATGQAVALYSRLHLVVTDSRKIRWVLYMIIATFLVLHIPAVALFYALVTRGDPSLYHPEQVYVKLVVTGLSVQEFIICGIYIYEAVRGLKPVLAVKGRAGRQVILNLIIANGIVVIINATVMMVAFANFHTITLGYTAFCYSLNLKLEFYALNKLLNLVQQCPCNCQNPPAWCSSEETFGLGPHLPMSDHNMSTGEPRRGSDQSEFGHGEEYRVATQENNFRQIAMSESQVHVSSPPRALSSSEHLIYTRAGLSNVEPRTSAEILRQATTRK